MRLDVDRVVERVRAISGRSFATRDLVVLPRHGFTLVVVADDLMAYVAADGEQRRALAMQRRVLARIASRVSFAVPRPVGPLELDGDVDVRVPAKGLTGSEHHERLLREPELARRAAEWMGRALAELHGSLARSELDALGVPPAPACSPGPSDVLLHGDFGTHNLAFDPTSGMPIGVFDFHGVCRGPAELDFAIVRTYEGEVYRGVMAAYGTLAPCPSSR